MGWGEGRRTRVVVYVSGRGWMTGPVVEMEGGRRVSGEGSVKG